MADLRNVTRQEFQEALTTEKVLVSVLAYVGLGFGILAFTGLAVFLFLASPEPGAQAPRLLDGGFLLILTALHLVLAGMFYLLGDWLYRRHFTPGRLTESLPEEQTLAEACVNLVRTAQIIRLAVFQAPALLGALILIVSALDLHLAQQPWLWINLVSPLLFLTHCSMDFPSRDRFLQIFEVQVADAGNGNTSLKQQAE